MLTTIFVVAGFAASVQPFASQMTLRSFPVGLKFSRTRLTIATALREVMNDDASIGILAAGVIPYYSDDTQPRRTVDFLGKVDRKVASLPPRVSPYINLRTRLFRPGHNKYDLTYSIQQWQPDYIETYERRDQSVRPWAAAHYVRVKYKGVELILLRGSKNVRWELLSSTMRPL
jgi:hypothetical protein